MLRVRKSAVGWAVALALAAAGLTPASPAAARAQPAPTIEWRPCATDASAECGTLSLPVDWNRPRGERFDLALARRVANPATREGALVFGPGGPGDSGVDRVVNGSSRFSADLRRRFDIVSFDPRGTGGSNPVLCARDLLARQPQLIADQAQFDATLAGNVLLRADCRARTGPLYDHVDTTSAARDLDAIRAALGERQLTFHGSSYGTLLGERYAELFPERVRAMVLEAAMDHSLGTRALLDTQAVTSEDAFDEFVAWCDRSTACVLHGQDFRAIWERLRARAERGVLTDPQRGGAVLTPFELTRLTHKAFYDTWRWPGLAEWIGQLAAQTAVRAVGTSTGDAVAPYPFAVFCQDWSLPVRDYREYAGHLRRTARLAPDLRYPTAVFALATCLGTPTPVANPQHRLRVRTDVPLLIAATVHDPASGYNWATNVARQLGRHGVLLTYEGWGHGSYTTSKCVERAVDAYLIDQVVPARGTRCPAVDPDV
ncbi:alpha/beta hydrolase [Micromonospora lupini]|uniref:Putative hydrolase n=1 Tax=Micromonospora lupini str. Lupac 08 TaxID=1150864 RepID=I0KVS0_9ACTN|nr:alpha/beta hydrolase [Micromonospora lupini]CCH15667.1 Putative hydrolase [Micromonospora lupini str. Lupac 08]